MNEELKVIITAEISKLKANTDKAKKEIKTFQDKVKEASKNVDNDFKKAGEQIGKAIEAGCKVAAAALTTVTTAVAGLVTASVKSYAEYEQLEGGVKKLFGDSADTIMQYAQNAYKTAGISANEYMTQVTSFSASLISSLGGDTAEAARVADMAISDMSDNANTFGTNIADIQNAYQGFAKQNYTMLDNLKLGYGGTKEEMERLIEDANKVKESMGETADLTIDSYADVIEAIHLVQDEMNITGTTMNEAESTIQGSIAMTKAAWENLMVGLADSNADIPQLVDNVISSATSVLSNIIPIAKEVLKNLPAAISEISPEAGAAFQTVVDVIMDILPVLKDALSTTFDIISKTINFVKEHTTLMATIAGIIGGIVAAIGLYNAVAAIKTAMDAAQVTTLGALIAAEIAHAAAAMAALAPYLLIVAAIAAVIAIIVVCIKHWDDIKEACANAWEAMKEAVSTAVDAIVGFFSNMWQGIKDWVTKIKDAVVGKFNEVKDKVSETVTNMKDKVVNKYHELKEGISEKCENIKTNVSEKFNSIKDTMGNIMENAKENVSEKLEKMKSVYEEKGGGIKGIVAATMEGVKGHFETVLSGINVLTGGKFEEIAQTMTEKLEHGKELIQESLEKIKEKFENLLGSAKEIVSNGLEKLKNLFKFEWSLPKIKLPHFSVTGRFSLSPPSIPHFSVSWYKLGGVFDSTKLFPYGNGSIGGLGEDGAEAVVPLEKNTQWLDKIATMLTQKQGGNQPIYLMVDGKVFGQVAVDSINDLTRMRGNLPLKLV